MAEMKRRSQYPTSAQLVDFPGEPTAEAYRLLTRMARGEPITAEEEAWIHNQAKFDKITRANTHDMMYGRDPSINTTTSSNGTRYRTGGVMSDAQKKRIAKILRG